MKLKDILKNKGTKVWTIEANQKIQDALQILFNQKIGALVVIDEKEHIAGIISERDIVRACYRKSSGLNSTLVSELMTKKVITASSEDNVKDIMQVMTENRIRHIPVVNEGKLDGIVSIGDVVKLLLEDSEHQIRSLKEYIYGSNL